MMKNSSTNYFKILVCFLLAFITSEVYSQNSQNGIYFRWYLQAGCYEYEDQRGIPLEDIQDDTCFKVCENSISEYQVIASDGLTFSDIEWNVSGGTITGNAFNKIEVEWDDATANAGISIKITLENGQVINKYICIDIIQGPQANFELALDQIHNCSGSDLNFINTSTPNPGGEIVSYEWEFIDTESNSTFSNEFEPSHTFNGIGIHTVRLTVVNDCNCTHTYEEDIEIAGSALSIECPTVVCEDETDMYFIDDTNNQCSSFFWVAEGGDIIGSNNNSTVEIKWNNVDDNGFGYVFFDQSDCGNSESCSSGISAKVPVIQNKGRIKGDTNLCQNEQYKYSLPQWPTTDFQWQLVNDSGQDFDSNLVLVDQRNQIVVDTENLPSGNYELISNYQNTMLGCGGSALLELTVNKQARVDGPQVVCSGDEGIYEEFSGVTNLNWEILFQGESYPILDQDENQMLAVFEDPGFYEIIVSAANLCPNENFVVEVKEKPETPSGDITGPTKICTEEPVTYTYNQNISEEYYLQWNVEGGSIQGATTGQEVTVIFDEQPGLTDFVVQASFVDKDIPSCKSNPNTLDVIKDPFPLDVVIENVMDEDTFCPSSISSEFELIDDTSNSPYEFGEVYEWSVEPVEFASIESGNNTNTITLNINEINFDTNDDPITQGELKLQVKRCGEYSTVQSIPINKYLFDLDIVVPTDVCRNETFDVTVNSNVPIDPNQTGSVDLFIENDNLGNQPVYSNNNQSITFEDISLPDDNNAQTQNIEVVFNMLNGCSNIQVEDTFNVEDTPVVEIDPVGNLTFCDDEDVDVTIDATILSGGGGSSNNTFQWFVNGNPVGNNSPSFNISQPASNNSNLDGNTYNVEVTNGITGCSEVSDDLTISIFDNCGGASGCDNPVNGSIDNLNWTGCNTFSAQANIPGGFTNLSWTISGPGEESVASGQGTMNAIFTVEEAGEFEIELYAAYPDDCYLFIEETIEKNYEPRLEYNISCNSTNDGYEITIENTSQLHNIPPSSMNVNYYLNGNPIPNNSSNPDLSQTQTLPAGTTNQISVEIFSGLLNDPICQITENIDVPSFPNADFSLSSPQCAGSPFLLSPDDAVDNSLDYTWSFIGTENLQAEHYISLQENPNEIISLTVNGPYGCSDTFTRNILVDEADFSEGFISGGGSYCNNLTTLQYTNPDPSQNPFDYQWMRGNEAIPNATNASYQPLQSGSYWVQVFNANGCVDDSERVSVTYITPPEANVDAPLKACIDKDFTITGLTLPENVEYQWVVDGDASGWSTDFPATLDQNIATTGFVDYSFHVRHLDNTDCINEIDFQVEVTEPTSIEVNQGIISCQPYRVKLIASGGESGGLYNWSNGNAGGSGTSSSIEVNHGGPYRLTYIPPDGVCETVVDIDVPKNPEEFMWIFPEGCFEFCRFEEPYLIGPLPVMDAYQWLDEGIIESSGSNDQVPNFPINNLEPQRNLQLFLSNNNCTVTSDFLGVTNNFECQNNSCKKINLKIAGVNQFTSPFEYFEFSGSITNNYSQTTSFTFTEANGDGIFNPSSFTLSPSQTINFNALTFIPNSGFNAGSIDVYVKHKQQGDIICLSEHVLDLPGQNLLGKSGVKIKSVSPNPFTQKLRVDYKIPKELNCNNLQLKVYDMQAKDYIDQWIDKAETYQELQTDSLPLGQYILILSVDGQIKDQKIIIKK